MFFFRVIVLTLCTYLLSLGFALSQQVLVDGSFVNGVNPPPGIGSCWHQGNQIFIPILVVGGLECDALAPCDVICDCCPGVTSPGNCPFRKTVGFVPVGTCVVRTNHQCKQCQGGSEVYCMVYGFYRRQIGGACANSCNEYQVHFGGTCTP